PWETDTGTRKPTRTHSRHSYALRLRFPGWRRLSPADPGLRDTTPSGYGTRSPFTETVTRTKRLNRDAPRGHFSFERRRDNVAGRIRGLLERLLARRREAAHDGVSDAELLRRFTQHRDEAAEQ